MKESELTRYCKNKLNLADMKLGEEYNYSCLPLAIIDAIYSILQNYSQVQKIVENYCDYYGIEKNTDKNNVKTHTISDMICNIESIGSDNFANEVLKAKNRTAGSNSILKSEAVYQWAKIMHANGIENFDDFRNSDKKVLKSALKNVQGQGDAAVRYLFMLCGSDDFCKPDIHILQFLTEATGEKIDKVDEVQALLEKIVDELKNDYPSMTVRQLDYIIWNYQRKKR